MNFEETPEFQKDFKRLNKKHRSLPADLRTFRNIATAAAPLDNPQRFRVITETEHLQIVKARLACRSLQRAVLRIVYAYVKAEQKIEFIELYFKGDKENEDRERIKRYLAANAE